MFDAAASEMHSINQIKKWLGGWCVGLFWTPTPYMLSIRRWLGVLVCSRSMFSGVLVGVPFGGVRYASWKVVRCAVFCLPYIWLLLSLQS